LTLIARLVLVLLNDRNLTISQNQEILAKKSSISDREEKYDAINRLNMSLPTRHIPDLKIGALLFLRSVVGEVIN